MNNANDYEDDYTPNKTNTLYYSDWDDYSDEE